MKHLLLIAAVLVSGNAGATTGPVSEPSYILAYCAAAIVCHLAIGFGFGLASWLQAAELQVNNNEKIDSLIGGKLITFMIFWPILAIYCYRAEVKKSISKIDWDAINKDTTNDN